MADGAHGTEQRAGFHAMIDGTAEDWGKIAAASVEFGRELPTRLVSHLNLLKGDCGGFAVDRLEHSLQTATRAHKDGRDEEYVVCALLHDIGDILGPRNHADIGAAIVQPFVSEANHWMVAHHGIFQGYYFFHHLGLDRDMREQYRGHPSFEHCAQFCHLYDQSAFDPNYESMPIEAFEPMLHRVMSTPKNSIYLRKSDAA
ncbi:putative HD phosphohydrolase [Caulobacter ginsengisoli]|uniref:HD phosphohydrolase n=1 Tax=Caulobacter ginsengisoli TaxID=400775 RepID=A0ABU0IRA3_9CAUL|nr:HD domain-containing protein [Caulobacter ginsengisoli]MDQ0464546.1 putative HD phosphohydrolase [Caulobacter ginsengisoli]